MYISNYICNFHFIATLVIPPVIKVNIVIQSSHDLGHTSLLNFLLVAVEISALVHDTPERIYDANNVGYQSGLT